MSRYSENLRHVRAKLFIVARVPSEERLRFRLKGAGCQECVIDCAPYDADRGEFLEHLPIFDRVQRDDGQPFPNVGDEKHPVLATDAMSAGHPRQRGIHFEETMRPAANILLGESGEEIQARGMVHMIAVKNRHQYRRIQESLHSVVARFCLSR